MSLSQLDIKLLLYGAGCPYETQIYVGGAAYAKPTLAWLQGDFYTYFKRDLWDANLLTWKPRWSCREFSRAWASDVQRANALSASAPAGEDAVLAGDIWFTPDASRYDYWDGQLVGKVGDGHAIGITVTDKGVCCIDPQNNVLWTLSPAEWASAAAPNRRIQF